MKKIIAIAGFLFLLSLPIFAKPVYKRITFKKGATTVIVTGKLSNYKDAAYYVVKLRAGQRLQISSNKSITLAEVANPSGEDVVDRAANCNGMADVSPTVAGDYKITVVECAKADAWKGTFKLKITAK